MMDSMKLPKQRNFMTGKVSKVKSYVAEHKNGETVYRPMRIDKCAAQVWTLTSMGYRICDEPRN